MESIKCQFLANFPQAGPVNMAVDEHLLDTVHRSNIPILRFYSWSEPTLSLGYFQAFSAREQYPPSLACPVVRRTTGGGAILHDRELTYSLIWPRGIRPKRFSDQTKGGEWMYRWVHESLVDVLRQMGADPRFSDPKPSSRADPFLCFERRSRWDLEIGNMKILGSAQRSHRGAILQHGSLLLESSRLAPHLAGLFDQTQTPSCPIDVMIARWSSQIAETADLALHSVTLDRQQQLASARLAREKYSAEKWTKKR